MKRRIFGLFLVAAAALVAGASLTKAFAKGPNACPAVWAPVICDNGKIYPNQCEADKKKAKNCEPYDGL